MLNLMFLTILSMSKCGFNAEASGFKVLIRLVIWVGSLPDTKMWVSIVPPVSQNFLSF